MHIGYFFKRIGGTVAVALCILIITDVDLADSDDCVYCVMSRAKCGHSRVVIKHDDGSDSSVCSIHCAVIDIAWHSEMSVSKITAGDYDTKRQVDADKACWVIGGERMVVMTVRDKWAFETKKAAENFMKAHGGRPLSRMSCGQHSKTCMKIP